MLAQRCTAAIRNQYSSRTSAPAAPLIATKLVRSRTEGRRDSSRRRADANQLSRSGRRKKALVAAGGWKGGELGGGGGRQWGAGGQWVGTAQEGVQRSQVANRSWHSINHNSSTGQALPPSPSLLTLERCEHGGCAQGLALGRCVDGVLQGAGGRGGSDWGWQLVRTLRSLPHASGISS